MNDSIISGELRKRLQNCVRISEQEYTCEVAFDPGFRGFEGHFDGNPIVPGVCMIELARVHAETALGKALRVTEISQCRFRNPILAGMEAECKLTVRTLDDGQLKIQSEIRTCGNTACHVRMKAAAL